MHCEKPRCRKRPSTRAVDLTMLKTGNSLARAFYPWVERKDMFGGLKVISLTDAAADRVKEIIANADKPLEGVRVGVRNAGCAGMAYTMEYAETATPGDDVVEDKGVKVFVDPKAVLFLLGTEMDFQVTKLASQFVFNNPNQTSACGCGESVAITPAKVEPVAEADSPAR